MRCTGGGNIAPRRGRNQERASAASGMPPPRPRRCAQASHRRHGHGFSPQRLHQHLQITDRLFSWRSAIIYLTTACFSNDRECLCTSAGSDYTPRAARTKPCGAPWLSARAHFLPDALFFFFSSSPRASALPSPANLEALGAVLDRRLPCPRLRLRCSSCSLRDARFSPSTSTPFSRRRSTSWRRASASWASLMALSRAASALRRSCSSQKACASSSSSPSPLSSSLPLSLSAASSAGAGGSVSMNRRSVAPWSSQP
mmetsp:Transcript_25396/g.85137  ORF Transcript_25396/g.85137 Transcript_25396/m.85137 type:complete len:257 (-) Transcript_25396:518-1288(-)